MFDPRRFRHALLLFHLVLGTALLWGSVRLVLHLASSDPHALGIGTVEAVAAVAFLIHAGRGEWRPDLLVYAAGVFLVSVDGDARASARPATRVA